MANSLFLQNFVQEPLASARTRDGGNLHRSYAALIRTEPAPSSLPTLPRHEDEIVVRKSNLSRYVQESSNRGDFRQKRLESEETFITGIWRTWFGAGSEYRLEFALQEHSRKLSMPRQPEPPISHYIVMTIQKVRIYTKTKKKELAHFYTLAWSVKAKKSFNVTA